MAAACQVCQGVSDIVLAKGKKNPRKVILNNRYIDLLCTKPGYVYDNIPSSILAIFLYFLFISSSNLLESALPDCSTDKLKATEIQNFPKLLTVQVFLVLFLEVFPPFYFS